MNAPDLEIYLKRVDAPEIISWLSRHFAVRSQVQKGSSLQIELEYTDLENNDLKEKAQPLTCTINENAVKGGYTSVWFPENHTPWTDDRDCARDAFSVFARETRCANGSWDQSEDDTGGWIRFTDAGESVVNWLA